MINRILYFFGYAPIHLKTEYKTVVINELVNFDVLKSEKEFEITINNMSDTYYKNLIKREILNEVEKKIEWNVTCCELPGQKRRIHGKLLIGKTQ